MGDASVFCIAPTKLPNLILHANERAATPSNVLFRYEVCMIRVRFIRDKLYLALCVVAVLIAALIFYDQRNLGSALGFVGTLAVLVRPPQIH